MIKVFSSPFLDSFDPPPADPATGPDAPPPDVAITLHLWQDANNVTQYLYTPYSSVTFWTLSPKQILRIELAEDSSSRYSIAGILPKTGKHPTDINCRLKGAVYAPHPVGAAYHKAPLPVNGQIFDGLQLILELGKKESTYFSVLVWDNIRKLLIDCDPQAENGTGG